MDDRNKNLTSKLMIKAEIDIKDELDEVYIQKIQTTNYLKKS